MKECLEWRPSDILRNNVKEKLARGEVVASMTVRLVRRHRDRAHRQDRGLRLALHRPRAFELLARDHGPDLHRRARGRDRAVRAGAGQHAEYISRVLDGGALGIIAPHVRSAAEARAVVRGREVPAARRALRRRACRTCTTAPSRRAEAYTALNDATMVIVQFESAAALDQRRRDRRGRRRRHGADRHQRPAGRLGLAGAIRPSARARSLRAHHRGLPQKHGKHVGVGGLA